MRRALLVAPVALLACACSALGGGGTAGVDAAQAEDALLAQRDDVAATAAELVAATRDAVGGEVVDKQGGWEGCTSIFPEGYADFQYAARILIKAPAAPERLAARLREAAGGTGLEVTGSSGDDVVVHDGDVSARLWDLPPVNTDGDVLIQLVAEPCVDVPEDRWEEWRAREDPGPALG